jgi:hypothetical protein
MDTLSPDAKTPATGRAELERNEKSKAHELHEEHQLAEMDSGEVEKQA